MKNDKKKVEKITEEEVGAASDQCEACKNELEEEKSKYLRALADYQNLERQTSLWKEEFVKYANSNLIRKLLELLDDLEKALEHIGDEGLKIVVNKLKGILKDEGISEIEILAQAYDPNLAEVVGTVAGEEDNTVVEVVQKGYVLKERVVRPAKVIVSTKT